ncbi:hypothetical protein A0H81_13383 [Grifola frondosa]|uniref:DUF6534 domain-containing protein n=1 Tax=Grifola frondosa TaxID=5627 RepID=A0A1C7LUM9_GRIFR|nr:hypothetical protein A0H81_13383 [Grifola frondosa]
MSIVSQFIGSFLIEVFIACILYGVTTLQTFLYFQKYPNDEKMLKFMVMLVWVLESVHTAFCMLFVYEYLVIHYGEMSYLGTIHWTAGGSIISGLVITLAVHLFYVRRVWILSSKSYLLTGVVALIALTRFVCGLVSSILSYAFSEWVIYRTRIAPLVTVSIGLGAAAIVDVLVAFILAFYLNRGRNNWQSQSSGRLNLIMIYAVNTGAITSIVSVLGVIFFATMKNSLIFLGILEIQSKLYANSFLGSLNARTHIRNKYSNPAQYPSFEFSTRSNIRTVAPPVPQVEVFQQTVVTNDAGEVELDFNKSIKGGELV